MSDLKVDFNFAPEVLQDAAEAEVEVERILEEVKGELLDSVSSDSGVVELSLAVDATQRNS